MGIAIFEDFDPEADEYFDVMIEELGISTRVTILDDDGNSL